MQTHPPKMPGSTCAAAMVDTPAKQGYNTREKRRYLWYGACGRFIRGFRTVKTKQGANES